MHSSSARKWVVLIVPQLSRRYALPRPTTPLSRKELFPFYAWLQAENRAHSPWTRTPVTWVYLPLLPGSAIQVSTPRPPAKVASSLTLGRFCSQLHVEIIVLTVRDRHVRVYHTAADMNDPRLRDVLAQRSKGTWSGRPRQHWTVELDKLVKYVTSIQMTGFPNNCYQT